MQSSRQPLRWLVTGAARGLGRAIAERALAVGDYVAGTVRDPDQTESFRAMVPGRAFPILLDVTDEARTAEAVAEAIEALGGIDVLVNNAGFAMVGSLEEYSEAEIREVLETNFFGTVRMIRSVLPNMRELGGRIVNITSAGGLQGFPGISSYCAAKSAVEGLSEALVRELAPFGIQVMAVTPGAFRTSFSGASIRTAANQIMAYDETPAGDGRRLPAKFTGRELGDPSRGAAVIVETVHQETMPARLILGSDALKIIRRKMETLEAQLVAGEAAARSTDFKDEASLDPVR